MTKITRTTVTETFDDKGNLIERVTEVEETEDTPQPAPYTVPTTYPWTYPNITYTKPGVTGTYTTNNKTWQDEAWNYFNTSANKTQPKTLSDRVAEMIIDSRQDLYSGSVQGERNVLTVELQLVDSLLNAEEVAKEVQKAIRDGLNKW